jgi:hypothetical protein
MKEQQQERQSNNRLSKLESNFEQHRIDKVFNRLNTAPDLSFLSQDDKLGLAVNSSLSERPGAYHLRRSNHALQQSNEYNTNIGNNHGAVNTVQSPISSLRKPSQMELIKAASRQRSVEIEANINYDGRRLPPIDHGPEIGVNECELLGDLQFRMINFQREISVEIQHNDERLAHDYRRKNRTYCLICLISILLTFVISIATSITLSVKGDFFDDSQNNSERLSGGTFFNIDHCYSITGKDLERYQNFRSILISMDPNMVHTIDTPYRSSSIALCWLSLHDSLLLTPSFENQLEIRERFVLAVIFFSFVDKEEFSNKFHVFSGRNWLTPTHVCHWDLVECDKSFRSAWHISGLDLSKIDPQKPKAIPTELCLLTNLTELYFYPRDMLGPIPSQLWNLTNLEEFSVSIIVEDMDAVDMDSVDMDSLDMDGVGKLSELRSLVLQANYHGRLPKLKRLQQLTHLALIDPSSNMITEFPDLHTLTNLGESNHLFHHNLLFLFISRGKLILSSMN